MDGVDLTGRGAGLDDSVIFALQEQGAFVPLRLGASVNGFRVDMRLKPTAPDQMQSYGIAFRVQDPANYYRFRVDVASSLWLLEQVEDDTATVIERGLIEGDLPLNVSVSGRDEFIRIEYAESRLQQQLSAWQQGGVALWLDTATPETSPLDSVQAGLLGDEAVAAADNPPTEVPPPLPPARLLLNDVRTLQSAGGADAIVDCGVFTETYDALERFDNQPDITDTAQRVQQVSAVIYNRCLLADEDSELDFNASLSDYLAWENNMSRIAGDLTAE